MSKTVRQHFTDLLREKGFSRDDMERYREISYLADKARNLRAEYCPKATDQCVGGDCGYDEGGCGNDECCDKLCDSCMVFHDTCGGDECGVGDFG